MKVGDTVYVVMNDNLRSKGFARISAIGTKWVWLDSGLRMEKGTMILDGGAFSSPGSCFLSEQHYLDEVSKNRLWSKLKGGLTWTAPSSVSNDDIKAAMKLLGIVHD